MVLSQRTEAGIARNKSPCNRLEVYFDTANDVFLVTRDTSRVFLKIFLMVMFKLRLTVRLCV